MARMSAAEVAVEEQAKKMLGEHRVLVDVEVILEGVTNVWMGLEIDNITEFEDLADSGDDAPTALYANID
jgi:tartronate-semialdehyde synthase